MSYISKDSIIFSSTIISVLSSFELQTTKTRLSFDFKAMVSTACWSSLTLLQTKLERIGKNVAAIDPISSVLLDTPEVWDNDSKTLKK